MIQKDKLHGEEELNKDKVTGSKAMEKYKKV